MPVTQTASTIQPELSTHDDRLAFCECSIKWNLKGMNFKESIIAWIIQIFGLFKYPKGISVHRRVFNILPPIRLHASTIHRTLSHQKSVSAFEMEKHAGEVLNARILTIQR
mmetsp:Transcript_12214/g.30065  ORF Transcript_12214/g.30065 Transcript_12214/m.30065 type:complete len:111 (+) Transcript_12214:699-1031(+)